MAAKTWTLLVDSEKRIQAFDTKCLRKLLGISCLEHKINDWERSKINFLVGPQEPLLAPSQETEPCMVWACHTPRQPLENHPSGHLGGWATPWSAEVKLMDNIKKWTSLPNARNAYRGLLQKTLEEHFCWIVCHVSPNDPVGQGTNMNWTDC